jgi:HNH endonuclease
MQYMREKHYGHTRQMTEKRFWSKVQKSEGCWLWLAGTYPNGYGRIGVNRHRVGAHRQAWIYTNGPIPVGRVICHKCDNPPCVNPAHLFLGTMSDNTQDMISKDRLVIGLRRTGQESCNARLSNEQAGEIRTLYADGKDSQQALGDRFGVSQRAISHIILRKTYA